MDNGVWQEGRDSLRERIQHTNVVVSCFYSSWWGVPIDFCREAYSLPRSQRSALAIHPRIPSSFHIRRRAQ